MHQFISLTPANDALAAWVSRFSPLIATETIPLDEALGRVAASPIPAPADLPGFARSAVDGYAVRARDTFGASEGLPALLNLVGQVVMGRPPGLTVGPGQTAWVPTGGALPDGADAVVMLEHAEALGDQIQVGRAAAPGENVLAASDDIARGQEAVPKGRAIGPGEAGLLAGLGIMQLVVTARPRVIILSTGDEVCPADRQPGPGQVRDINSHAIAAAVLSAGGVVAAKQWVPDDEDALTEAIRNGATEADLVVLSGGSSVGNRDFTLSAINRAGAPGVLVHGVAIRPGKPTALGVISGVPILGLPGHPVSALIAWRLFGPPALARLCGTAPPARWVRRAVLTANLPSAPGREDFYCVRLADEGGLLRAVPVLGKSGLISTLVNIDGLLKVASDREGLQAGETVEVELF